jgi:hypothetical protein
MVALQTNVNGALKVDGSAVTQPVSGTFWQATQPVSGTVTANQGGAPWTATIQQGGNSAVVKAASTAAAATDPSLVVNISPNSPAMAMTQSGTWTVQPGNTANTTPWLATINQGGNSAVVKAASTAAAAADPSLVVAESPNSQISTATGTIADAAWNGSGNSTVVGALKGIYTSVSGSIPAGVNSIGGVTQSGNWTIAGDIASGSADSGNPVKIGGLAKTTNPTAVSDGQRVTGVFDKQGKQVVVGALRQLKGVQVTTITVNTETIILTAGAAGVFQDLYGLTIANTSATAVNVAIKDSSAGTTRLTLMVPAGDTRGFMLPVDSAIPQASAANNWTATASAAVSSLFITALYVSNL